MRILAFDQSSRVTGYAVFDNDRLIAYDKFTCTSDDIGERLVQIRKMLLGLIAIYDPDAVAFEDIQLQNNQINNSPNDAKQKQNEEEIEYDKQNESSST